ncbi:hypothetical protein JW992_00320 [candidate division KSB1 bacterium]|nr:hypothetical protein [candidate division KSB1 bacterium]
MRRVERLVFWAFLFFLVLTAMGCRGTRFVDVQEQRLELALESGMVEAFCYTPTARKAGAAVLIGMLADSMRMLWEATARQMAGMGYAVVLLPETGVQLSAVAVVEEHYRAGMAALNGQCPVDSGHAALVSIGSAAPAAIAVAAADDRVRALVLISPSVSLCDSVAGVQLGRMAGRPVVVLESMGDRAERQNDLDRFWEAIAEPKKRVFLETFAVGGSVIRGDLEPVVRRVILLLCDRYVLPVTSKR